jgi:Flp pilus assembly protein TadD
MMTSLDFEWQKSPAHLFLLSAFLIPRTLGDICDNVDWKMVLGEEPQNAVSRFVTKGLIEPCDLSIQLERKFKKTELLSLLGEHDTKVSSRKSKAELVQRLIDKDEEGMKKLFINNLFGVLQCTKQGREMAQEFKSKGIQVINPENAVSPEYFRKGVRWVTKEAAKGVIDSAAFASFNELASKLRKSTATKKNEELPEPNEEPPETPVTPDYIAQGDNTRAVGDYQQAIDNYTKAIELNPRCAEAYNGRGIAYRRLGDYKEAIANYTKAIELNPRFPEAYNNRGNVYWITDDYKKARQDYNTAIELNPQYAEAYNGCGNVYWVTGDYEKAMQDYNTAIELKPRFPEVYNGRGNVYWVTGENEKAMQDYNTAIELNPQYAEAFNGRGIIYERMGDERNAMINYAKAVHFGSKYRKELKSYRFFHMIDRLSRKK